MSQDGSFWRVPRKLPGHGDLQLCPETLCSWGRGGTSLRLIQHRCSHWPPARAPRPPALVVVFFQPPGVTSSRRSPERTPAPRQSAHAQTPVAANLELFSTSGPRNLLSLPPRPRQLRLRNKIPQPGLKQHRFISRGSGSWAVKFTVTADSVPGKDALSLWLVGGHLLLCPHMAFL